MNLREARFRMGITQWGLQRLAGVHQSRISLIEKGYIKPSETEKMKLTEALGFQVDETE